MRLLLVALALFVDLAVAGAAPARRFDVVT
jgi:hypothetical protein